MVSSRKRKELKARKEKELQDIRRQHAEAFGAAPTGKRALRKLVRGNYKPTKLVGRAAERNNLPSLETKICDTSKIEAPKYTGDNLLGVALMHKSNYVPIFKKEDAVSVAKMRRN